jgi:hypothetical protein
LLPRIQLASLSVVEKKNPFSAKAAPMKLYKRSEVSNLASYHNCYFPKGQLGLPCGSQEVVVISDFLLGSVASFISRHYLIALFRALAVVGEH